MQLFEEELAEDELLAAAMFFQVTDEITFDRPLNLPHRGFENKLEPIDRVRSNRLSK